ncbi:MAG: DUF2007 domain-containing protein [Clostridia bacterium]|nr:DUF2007 domain-containing protein [Clostridia bacterium]
MDRFFGLDKASLHDEGLSLLTTYYDATGLALARGLLDAAEIPYLCRERGAGGVARLVTGFNLYGTDIYVREADLDAAAALLAPPDEGSEEDGQ